LSFRSASTVPAGNLANASSVGAKTVNGPGPLRVFTRSAALTAATSVLNEPAAIAVSTIFYKLIISSLMFLTILMVTC